MDMCNFANCFILSYTINTFELNNIIWVMSPATLIDKYRNTECAMQHTVQVMNGGLH